MCPFLTHQLNDISRPRSSSLALACRKPRGLIMISVRYGSAKFVLIVSKRHRKTFECGVTGLPDENLIRDIFQKTGNFDSAPQTTCLIKTNLVFPSSDGPIALTRLT